MSAATAEHYAWGDGCDGWRLLDRTDLGIIEERMPTATAEVRHHHERARQFFFVLRGSLTIELAGVVHHLEPGRGLHVPPGVPHRVSNESGADVRFLVCSHPRAHGDRIPSPGADEHPAGCGRAAPDPSGDRWTEAAPLAVAGPTGTLTATRGRFAARVQRISPGLGSPEFARRMSEILSITAR